MQFPEGRKEVKQSLFRIVLVLTFIYMIILPMNIYGIILLLRLMSLALLTIICVKHFMLHGINRMDFILLTGFIFTILVSSAASSMALTIDNIISLFSIIVYLVLIIAQEAVQVNQRNKALIYYGAIIITGFYFAYSFTSLANWTGDRYTTYLTLGMDNSNTTGIYLFLIYSLILITMQNQNRILSLSGILILLWLIWRTGARSVLIAAVALPCLDVIFRKRKIPELVVLLLCAVPFVFVPVYLWMYHNIDNTVILGKTLFSGRQYTFQTYLDKIQTPVQVLIGNLSNRIFQNAHNGPLSIYTSSGVLGSFCFFGIIFRKLFQATQQKYLSNTRTHALLVLVACFIHSCGEGALFLGGFPAITFLYVFFVFLKG